MKIEDIKEYLNEEIDMIIRRMQFAKTKEDILKWLSNFEPDHQLDALMILEKFTYISDTDLFEKCNNLLTDLNGQVDSNRKIYLLPIAKYGKSATRLTYYMQKSPISNMLERTGRIKYLIHDFDLAITNFTVNSTIVFFDDFIGTGGSFENTFNLVSRKCNPTFAFVDSFFAMGIFYMPMAETRINTKFPHVKIIGELYPKIFSYPPCLFETQALVNQLKQIAEKYADDKLLFVGRTLRHNLGYKDSQALLSFSYNPPNNTVPIIWSTKTNWKPIFPRDIDHKIQSGKQFRLQNAIAAAKVSMDMPSDMSIEKMTDKKIVVLGVLRLLSKKIAIITVALKLGLLQKDLDEYLKLAKDMNFLDENNMITEQGKKMNEEFVIQINEFKKKNDKKLPYQDVSTYLPRQFSGK